MLGGCPGCCSEPKLNTMRTPPNQREHRVATPSAWGVDEMSSLGKRGFGEICERRCWVGMLLAGSGAVAPHWVAWPVLRHGGCCCIVLCGVVVRRVALRCVKLWHGA